MKNWFFMALSLGVLSGCSTQDAGGEKNSSWSLFSQSPVEQQLNKGVKEYEEGNYIAASSSLQGVLDNKSAHNDEKVKAYKYLAFIQCVTSREKMCREYFRKALALDPSFDLTAAESGHPLWGPIFKSVKSKPAK